MTAPSIRERDRRAERFFFVVMTVIITAVDVWLHVHAGVFPPGLLGPRGRRAPLLQESGGAGRRPHHAGRGHRVPAMDLASFFDGETAIAVVERALLADFLANQDDRLPIARM